jgi:hypothetical protein
LQIERVFHSPWVEHETAVLPQIRREAGNAMNQQTDKIARFCDEFAALGTIFTHFEPGTLSNKYTRRNARVHVEVADEQLMFHRGAFRYRDNVAGKAFMPPHRGGDFQTIQPILARPGLTSLVERAYAIGSDNVVLNQHTWVQEDDFIIKQLLPSPWIDCIIRTITTRWEAKSSWGSPETELDVIIHKAPPGRAGFKRLLECDPARYAVVHYGGNGMWMPNPASISDPIYAFAKERLSVCVTNFFNWAQEGGLVAAIKQSAYYGCADAHARIGDVEILSNVWKTETGPNGAPKASHLQLTSGSSVIKFQIDLDPVPGTFRNGLNFIHSTVEGAETLFAKMIAAWNPETSKLGPAPVQAQG